MLCESLRYVHKYLERDGAHRKLPALQTVAHGLRTNHANVEESSGVGLGLGDVEWVVVARRAEELRRSLVDDIGDGFTMRTGGPVVAVDMSCFGVPA